MPDQTVNPGDSVILHCTATDADGDTLLIGWDSSPHVDLTNPTSLTPSFTAPNARGDYTFRFHADDGHGGLVSDSVKVTVQNQPPTTPVITQVPDNSLLHPTRPKRSPSPPLPPAPAPSRMRGAPTAVPFTTPDSSGVFSYKWTTAGTYHVYVKATDDTSTWSATASKEVDVKLITPSVTICTPAPSSVVNVGQAVSFSASGSGGSGTLSYSWNFGDGSTPAPTAVTTHAYTAASTPTYTATVTVTDSTGQTATASVTLTVNAALIVTITPPHPLHR